MVSEERKAEIRAIIDDALIESGWLPKPKKPKVAKLVCVAGKIIGDAIVRVSPKDPNWYRRPNRPDGFDGTIQVGHRPVELIVQRMLAGTL